MTRWVVAFVIFHATCFDVFAQRTSLNRAEIKRNNHRMYTHQGRIRVKFGADQTYSSVDVSINALNYYGDLAPLSKKISTDLSLTKEGFGIGYSLRVGSRISISSAFNYGTIRGSDTLSANGEDPKTGIYRFNRNLSFRNRIAELSLMVSVDAVENKFGMFNRKAWTPYGVAGIAVFKHNPQAIAPSRDLWGNELPQAGQWVDLHPLGTEGQFSNLRNTAANYGIKPYSLIQPAIIAGLGVRRRLSDVFDVTMEFTVRYLFTDYLDDVSRNFVDLGALRGDVLAEAMSYRSNEVATPVYQYTSEYNGKTYNVLPGYGSENEGNMRGKKTNNDVYTAATIRFSYLFTKIHFNNRAKFR